MLTAQRKAEARSARAPQYGPYTPFTTSVASDLGSAFADVCRSGLPGALGELHDATVQMVERLQADGLPPERVIIAIKEALVRNGECRLPTSLYDESPAHEQQATAYRRVFSWFLDTYYGARPGLLAGPG